MRLIASPTSLTLALILLVGCGHREVTPNISCSELHKGCIEESQMEASNALSYYGIVFDCEWDYGVCAGKTSTATCDSICSSAYIYTTCEFACGGVRGQQ